MTDKNIEVRSDGKTQQFFTAVILNLLAMTNGIGTGWPSPVIPQLRSSRPPIGDSPMSEDEVLWISSLLPIGGLIIVPFCGILVENLGRRKFTQLTALPYIIAWLFIIFAENYIYLYVARFSHGMGAAMTVIVVPLYVSEIASDDIRGNLGSLILFSLNVGILLAYVAGTILSYHLFASLSMLCPIVFLVASVFIAETPVYLVRRNRLHEAHKSLMFFRGNNEALVKEELSILKSQVRTCETSTKKIQFNDLFRDRATRKGLIISIGLLVGQQFSGIFAMISYAEMIFKKAGSSVSVESASILIALIQFIGAYLSTILMDRAGRRPLSLMSSLIMAISHGIVGLFFYLQQNDYDVNSISWLPLIALSIYMVTYCLGIGAVPFVVMSEVFHLEVVSFATNFCFIVYWIIILIAIKAFDFSMTLLGPDWCFFMLASFCAATFVFVYCLLPETKGRKREDIVNELAINHKSSDFKKFYVSDSTNSNISMKV